MTSPDGSLHDAGLAAELAAGAGRLLLDVRTEFATADPSRRRAEGDQRAHEWLVGALGRTRPGDVVLSEEGADDPRRLGAERIWIVDPLDGTREFGEPGRDDWAVHVALADGRGRLLAGAVALPARGLVLATDPAPALPAVESRRPLVVCSRSRPSAESAGVAQAIGGVLHPLGSAGAKTAAVVLGEADAYVHAGGMFQWDSAAPAAVALAAGLHASRIDGAPLVYNRSDLSLPDLLVCRPELADACLAALAAVGS